MKNKTNAKTGLNSFMLDVDFLQDIRIRRLVKYQGGKAVAVYASLLCSIYRNGYYKKWDQELPFAVSEYLGFNEAYVQEVINCCIQVGLFDEALWMAHQVLSSQSIQLRYKQLAKMARRTYITIDEYSLLDGTEYDTQEPAPEPPPDPIHKEKLLASPIWCEQMCMKHHLDRHQLHLLINDFELDCQCRGVSHDTSKEAKQHFNNWLLTKDKVNNERSTTHKSGTQADGRQQRAADYAATIASLAAQDDSRHSAVRQP